LDLDMTKRSGMLLWNKKLYVFTAFTKATGVVAAFSSFFLMALFFVNLIN